MTGIEEMLDALNPRHSEGYTYSPREEASRYCYRVLILPPDIETSTVNEQ